MVPMVFVYAPTILIVLPEHFTLLSFLQVSITCALGVFAIGTAISAYFMAPLNGIWRAFMAITGLLLVAPSLESDVIALVLVLPVVIQQSMSLRSANQTV
jgi:TRAP-type uncharacterized transport system fused permease subunit